MLNISKSSKTNMKQNIYLTIQITDKSNKKTKINTLMKSYLSWRYPRN